MTLTANPQRKEIMVNPDVAIIVGSASDLEIVEKSGMTGILDGAGASWSISAISAHRNPDELKQYVETQSVRAYIAVAGLAAALPGAIVSHLLAQGRLSTPVLGVALSSDNLDGLDALLSICRLPPGVPVALTGIDKPGLKNAAWFAGQIVDMDPAQYERFCEHYRSNSKPPQLNLRTSKETDTQEKKLVIEGKTKQVWRDPNDPRAVLLESKDDITANDGEGHELLTGKGVAATTTTCATFPILEEAGIPTHFLGQVDERTFRAHAVTMISIEIVMRRIAFGSFLKRHPDIEPKSRFEPVRVEFFKKDDDAGDPLMIVDPITNRTLLFEPKRPMSDGTFIGEEAWPPFGLTIDRLLELMRLGERTFLALERALASREIVLVDLKIECGMTDRGQIVVADVIDNDSWRIWPGGDENAMKDKQRFRDFVDSGDPSETEQVLASIGEDYHWVAEVLKELAAELADAR